MNIFIEGLQGTGKTTLLDRLHDRFPAVPVYREGDVSPVELAWCAYLTEAQWAAVCGKYPHLVAEMEALSRREDGHLILPYTRIHGDPAFFADMEAYEIYNARIPKECFCEIILRRYRAYAGTSGLFECSFLQNTVETMLMFYQMSEDDILAFYREAFACLRDQCFMLIYLDAADIRRNLNAARKERVDEQGNEIWFAMMMDYYRASPYGKTHADTGFESLVAYMEQRQYMERRILTEIIGKQAIILPEKVYAFDALLKRIAVL